MRRKRSCGSLDAVQLFVFLRLVFIGWADRFLLVVSVFFSVSAHVTHALTHA